MNIKIIEAQKLVRNILEKTGFSSEEVRYCSETCLAAELAGKKTHGFVRIPILVKLAQTQKINYGAGDDISVAKETPVSLLVDGQGKTGMYVVNKALELAIAKVKQSGLLITSVTNTAMFSGFIGHYARKAAENDLIYIGFNNSSGGLVPYGSISQIFGTNPFTVSVPTNTNPVILDMSSSQITWGNLLLAKAQGKSIPENVAIDKNGNMTTDAEEAMSGGVLPFGGHKGSGLAFIVEILGGALTGSRCGFDVAGGWGSLFFLIDPNILRPIAEFKQDVESLIAEVKNSPKMKGFDEIYYPGEQSQLERAKNLAAGEFELDDQLYAELSSL